MLRALIFGITGQDGAYLAQHLQSLGYEVFGASRHSSGNTFWRLEELGVELDVFGFDMLEYETIRHLIRKLDLDEVYNLAAQSFVGASFKIPISTCNVNGLGVLRILEVIRGTKIKLYQASTSEMFGNSPAPQNELTPFAPRSPYGCAKLMAHHLCVNYREAYGARVSSGILFNHESPLRGREFVTQKIAHGVWQDRLELGNMDARRDWGHARDYVKAMHLMLQEGPDDYVIATGETHSVRDFFDEACKASGRVPELVISDKHKRPTEVDHLYGDPGKAKRILGWEPEISFPELVAEMVDAAA